jgi:hypothetical protein
LVTLSSWVPAALAGSRNITVDDASNSVVWSDIAPDVWDNQNCSGCSAKPPSLGNINDGTWHDGTHHDGNGPLTASLTFNGMLYCLQYLHYFDLKLTHLGTGVYVFGITINSTTERPFIKSQNLQFTIDSQLAGTFTYTPDTPDYHYNVPFFGASGLSSGVHTVEMTVVGSSFVLIDYFVVAVPTDEWVAPCRLRM